MAITLVGIDCATQAKKIGLARGFFDNGKAQIDEVIIGARNISIVDTIAGWISSTQNALIAIDAPLGWPTALGQELHDHTAGRPLQTERNEMFSRLTDRVVCSEVGKKPLDVGSNLIARTAHAALELLEALRAKTREDIPLAWEPMWTPGTYTIEVYPAATLEAYKIYEKGYNKGKEARRKMLNKLREHIRLPFDTSLMENNADALDAAICVLAGADFLRGEVIETTDIEIARKEGWIWVRKPT